MTRTSGTSIIAAPCCRAKLATPQYGSINLSAFEDWTDGQTVGSLSPFDGGLRRCTCGSYFLLRQAEKVGYLPRLNPRAPVGWEKRSLLSRILGKSEAEREHIRSIYDTRPETEIAADEALVPPDAARVRDTELPSILNSHIQDTDILEVVRRRRWRHLNDSYREVYRLHKKSGAVTYPEFEPTPEQIDNMQQLLLIVERSSSPDWLEVSELHRELGEFDKALACLDHVAAEEQDVASIQRDLITKGLKCPVSYRL